MHQRPESARASMDARFDDDFAWDSGKQADALFDAWAQGRCKPPFTVGHEFAGVVEKVGSLVTDVKVGGQGCSISQSSASMMSQAVKGKPVDEVRALVRRFKGLMSIPDEDGNPIQVGDPISETMSGLEVEELQVLGEGLDGVLVAEILSCERHPEADRLQVCQVATGAGTVQIVCGAPNARPGLKAPLAIVGATLPGGIHIQAAKLRGVDSQGMLCSAKELGIDADASGLLELPANAPVGEPIAAFLGLPDASFELKLTPNRADCFSVRGIAFDVAAATRSEVVPFAADAVPATGSRELAIELNAGAEAPRQARAAGRQQRAGGFGQAPGLLDGDAETVAPLGSNGGGHMGISLKESGVSRLGRPPGGLRRTRPHPAPRCALHGPPW
mgnify:CR=1 FL=1